MWIFQTAARQTARLEDEQGNICSVGFSIDNGAWNDFEEDPNKARNFIYQVVMFANEIYGSQIRIGYRPGVKFVVGSITAATDRYCARYPQDMNCHIRTEDTGEESERFLKLLSNKDLRKVCLHYVITNRSFGPVQGIAYVQGVCSAR